MYNHEQTVHTKMRCCDISVEHSLLACWRLGTQGSCDIVFELKGSIVYATRFPPILKEMNTLYINYTMYVIEYDEKSIKLFTRTITAVGNGESCLDPVFRPFPNSHQYSF